MVLSFTQIQVTTLSIINQRRTYNFPTIKLRVLQPQAKHESKFYCVGNI